MPSYDEYTFVKVELRDGVAVCTLNRPDALNSVTHAGHAELESLFVQLAGDTSVKAIVLTGAGRAFCAGGDVKEMGSGAYDQPGGIFDSGARQLVAKMLTIEQPIVAAVNGVAVGLGATLALLCDVIFMADTARIGDSHVKVGLVPGDGGSVIWPLLVGPARAKEYLMTGDLIPAAEAERIGLVNRVVPVGEALAAADALAEEIAAQGPLAVREAKRLIDIAADSDIETGLAAELDASDRVFASEDMLEGASAFFAKRDPEYHGR